MGEHVIVVESVVEEEDDDEGEKGDPERTTTTTGVEEKESKKDEYLVEKENKKDEYLVESVVEEEEGESNNPTTATCSTDPMMDLNMAMEALEQMRRENLVLKFGPNVDFNCCVQCLCEEKRRCENFEVKR